MDTSLAMGYYRPVSAFNIGKQSEHKERTFFSEAVTRERIEKVKDQDWQWWRNWITQNNLF